MVYEELSVREESPDSAPARAILRAYLADVVGRYHRRSATTRELDQAVQEFPSEDLLSPDGVLLLAWLKGRPVGCAGLRFGQDGIGEVVRVFVDAEVRRCGIGRMLMNELAVRARRRGLQCLRLDTRDDLTESRRLYGAVGFREVAPFNDGPHADHWFEQSLRD